MFKLEFWVWGLAFRGILVNRWTSRGILVLLCSIISFEYLFMTLPHFPLFDMLPLFLISLLMFGSLHLLLMCITYEDRNIIISTWKLSSFVDQATHKTEGMYHPKHLWVFIRYMRLIWKNLGKYKTCLYSTRLEKWFLLNPNSDQHITPLW